MKIVPNCFSNLMTMEMMTFLLMTYLCDISCRPALSLACHRGSYVHTSSEGRDVCLPCTAGINFMPETDHTNRECYPCSQVLDDSVEILISSCNRTNDAEILCQDGYYRRKARSISEKDACRKCSQCENPVRACQGYHDTVCCDSPDNAAVLDKDGVFACEKHVCGLGQYFNTPSRECLPCSVNTFMNFDNHTYTECFKCPDLSNGQTSHAVVAQECNSTSPTMFGCKGGYFRDPGLESLEVEVSCSPCQVCQNVGRDCDMFHDTVCCQEPGMMVVDAEYGPECLVAETLDHLSLTSNQTVCEEGQYLFIDQTNNSHICKAWPETSNMDEHSHTRPMRENQPQIEENLDYILENFTFSSIAHLLSIPHETILIKYVWDFTRYSSSAISQAYSQFTDKSLCTSATVGHTVTIVLRISHTVVKHFVAVSDVTFMILMAVVAAFTCTAYLALSFRINNRNRSTQSDTHSDTQRVTHTQ